MRNANIDGGHSCSDCDANTGRVGPDVDFADWPGLSTRFFTTPLENDPSRDVRLQMQLHLPNPRAIRSTRTAAISGSSRRGEITFTVRGQEPRVLKTGESVYIPRGTVHRNENKSTQPTRTIELLIIDKGKPQNNARRCERGACRLGGRA